MGDFWNDDQWLDTSETEMLVKYGYYSKRFKFNPKGKIISLNTNGAYHLNWRLLVNRYDPGHMLEWFENELREIEAGHVQNEGATHTNTNR